MLDDTGSVVRVYLFDEPSAQFQLSSQTYLSSGCQADSVSFIDIAGDGTLEMLITQHCKGVWKLSLFQQYKSRNQDNTVNMFRALQSQNDILIQNKTQPVLGDFNGDLSTDILFTDPQNQKKVALIFPNKSRQIVDFRTLTLGKSALYPGCMNHDASLPLATPHSSAFADLDGDCASDLLLITQPSSSQLQLQIWAAIPALSKFCLVQKKSIPRSEYSQIAIADFNDDAALDLIFVGASSKSLYIHYNQYIPTQTSLCGLQSVSKSGSSIFQFFNPGSNFIKIPNFLAQNEIPYTWNDLYPFTIRVGDITQDAYSDILLTVSNGATTTAWVYINEQCKSPQPKGKRCFYQSNRILGDRLQGARYAVFFDLDENGAVDILYGRAKGNSGVNGLYNNEQTGLYFFKTLAIRQPKKYGDAIHGVNYRFAKPKSYTQELLMGGTQLSQTGYNALQMPYCLFGIGTSNDFINQFKVALWGEGSVRVKTYQPIMPNSQLIVTVQGVDPNNWILELFVNPTKKLLLIAMVIGVFLIILFIIVLVMQIKEYKKDLKENMIEKLH